MLTPPLQKKITHVPVGVFFGLLFLHLFVSFLGVPNNKNLVLFWMFSSHFFGQIYLVSGGEPSNPQPKRETPVEVSTALDLSPIPEDREKAAEAPRGDWDIVVATGGWCLLGVWEICRHDGPLVGGEKSLET